MKLLAVNFLRNNYNQTNNFKINHTNPFNFKGQNSVDFCDFSKKDPIKKEKSDLLASIESLNEEKNDFREKFNETKKLIEELKTQIASTLEFLKTTPPQSQDEEKSLRQHILDMELQIASLNEALDLFKFKIRIINDKIDRHTRNIEQLKYNPKASMIVRSTSSQKEINKKLSDCSTVVELNDLAKKFNIAPGGLLDFYLASEAGKGIVENRKHYYFDIDNDTNKKIFSDLEETLSHSINSTVAG